ncbi:hypothetical protein LAZ67_5002718 [Cordylochernes scorpioides]|uniref:Maturase K n=1 Tax=Cordylochernes scorpioides TaxID=51811 RepID=A0ABY6KHB9_9ARAC|nr:hypothetical protein LAZ67_5002718 [Cordylochernes scorpioides]
MLRRLEKPLAQSGFVVISSTGISSSWREGLALTRRWIPGVSFGKYRSWPQGLLDYLQFVFPKLRSISTKAGIVALSPNYSARLQRRSIYQ